MHHTITTCKSGHNGYTNTFINKPSSLSGKTKRMVCYNRSISMTIVTTFSYTCFFLVPTTLNVFLQTSNACFQL